MSDAAEWSAIYCATCKRHTVHAEIVVAQPEHARHYKVAPALKCKRCRTQRRKPGRVRP